MVAAERRPAAAVRARGTDAGCCGASAAERPCSCTCECGCALEPSALYFLPGDNLHFFFKTNNILYRLCDDC